MNTATQAAAAANMNAMHKVLPQKQFLLDLGDKLVVDLFAGGGGASTGLEQALGRHVDIAVNHDPDAIGMHEVNHPQTKHYIADVWEVDPIEATQGRPVGLVHASFDCTHHSQALGGQPRKHEIRALGWVVHRWAGKVNPDALSAENVEQLVQWSPLVAKRDKATGRVITLDKVIDPATGKSTFRVADKGEVVPRNNQYLVPNKKKLGRTWRQFIEGLRTLGYVVQWKIICNANLGAHSTRERLYMVARRDGLPIAWPEHTHAKKPKPGQKQWRPASECIDWSIPGRSIFARPKPLAEATLRRIAFGMHKYILNAAEPFIVPATHVDKSDRTRSVRDPLPTVTTAHRGELMLVQPTLAQANAETINFKCTHCGFEMWVEHDKCPRCLKGLDLKSATLIPVTHSRDTAFDVQQPLRTITTAKGGETALATATLVQMGYGERKGQSPRALDLDQPLGTVVAGGLKHGLATAFMVQANGGFNETHARSIESPMSTVTTKGSQQQLITAHLATLRRNSVGADVREPLSTITAGGEHHALIQYQLSKEDEAGALRCAAFLMRYHGSGGQWSDIRDPMTTVTTRDRLALVTVWLKGEPFVVVDICLRMLVPRELYNAQDFPSTYIIDRTSTGRKLTNTAQVRMCGNSVSPLAMKLIIEANFPDVTLHRKAA